MKKGLKILGIVLLSIVGLVLILEIITFIRPYLFAPIWMTKGTSFEDVRLGDAMFNNKLGVCAYAYDSSGYVPLLGPGEKWSIQGLKNGKCIVAYEFFHNDHGNIISYPDAIIKHTYTCKLPENIYAHPADINWSEIMKSDYCD
jgi:hypothetical protein